MLTEAQARTHWCPFVRVVHTDAEVGQIVAANSWGDGQRSQACMCVGSMCMAWRWFEPSREAPEAAHAWGWCGLAGPPTPKPNC